MNKDVWQESESLPETAEEALRKWDEGKRLWSVEMGGLGPAYEQCIQILVFEMIRDGLGKPLRVDSFFGNQAVKRLNPMLMFSGAQVGAARALAAFALEGGWRKTVNKFPMDRRIQVSKEFPRWEESDAR